MRPSLIVAILLLAPTAALVETADVARATFDDAFVWPMDGHVTSIYWECRSNCTRYHDGIDIANGCGSSIHAARPGTVSSVANDPAGYGNYVMVDHDLGYVTLYAHMSSVSVATGDLVTTSTQLGIEGATGDATGCHVHFEIRQDDEASDTRQFVPAKIGDTIHRGDSIPFASRLVRVTRATTLLDGPDIKLVSGRGAVSLGNAQAGDVLVAHTEWTNSDGETWLAVSWAGRDAWVLADDSTATTGAAIRVSADGALNVRSGAGTSNSIVGHVYGGQAYTTLASALDGSGATWFQIPYGSGTGWIHSGYTTNLSFTAGTTLAGRKIAVDPGHGGTDPGASGFGTNEKDVTLAIALDLRDLLRADGASVVMTRESDATVNLSARTNMANAAGVDRFVSIHTNSCGSCGARGTETYYHTSLPATSTSAHMAAAVQPAVASAFGSTDRGVKQADDYVLRQTTMPAILIETGFIDESSDHARLVDPATQRAVAIAILHGLQAHFGVAVHDPFGASWDFESGAPGWTFTNAGGSGAWGVSNARSTSPSHSLAIAHYGAGESDSATTPPVTLGQGATLSFSSWMDGERSCLLLVGALVPSIGCTIADSGKVEVSADGGQSWETVLADHWTTNGAFVRESIDLSGHAGFSVLVRFTFVSDGSVQNEGWYVDDVRIG